MSAAGRHRATFGLASLAALSLGWLVACGGSDQAGSVEPSSSGGSGGSTSTGCKPAEARPCPCIGGTQMGTQICDASGQRYAACTGCPVQMSVAGAAGASGSAGGSGGAAGGGSSEATDKAALMDVGTAAPGVWCGVGLPALCDLDTEKCCDRTLQPDSCIANSASCECDLDDCEVMEAHCDGPEDCENGQLCCGTLVADPNLGSRYTTFACSAQCSLEENRPEACHTSEDTCPAGLECANSQILANVQICIDPETINQDP